MLAGGHFQTQVYYVETMDMFITADSNSCARPTSDGWVVTRYMSAEEILIERYHGQPYVGVVRILQCYPLTESVQRDPQLSLHCPG